MAKKRNGVTITAPNGDEFTIAPFGSASRISFLESLREKGIDVSQLDFEGDNFLKAVGPLAAAKEVLAGWKINRDGKLVLATEADYADLWDRDTVLVWIWSQSQRLANERDKEFLTDLGNS